MPKKISKKTPAGETDIIGEKLNFEGTEAFNTLRENLFFSFADEKKCHTVGITSAMPGSGKSTCAANLAFAISKAEKKVLLIDGDMRLPTIGTKLELKSEKGLSHVLVGDEKPASAAVRYNDNMDVILSGAIPPRPSELLGSERMSATLKELSETYQYIIVDLPPIEVVSDALAVSKYLDGMIVVVHKDACSKNALEDTVRKLKMANANILGFVMSEAE